MARLKQHFLSFVFYITKILRENCVLLFDWFSGENCIMFTFSLQKDHRLRQIKKKHE